MDDFVDAKFCCMHILAEWKEVIRFAAGVKQEHIRHACCTCVHRFAAWVPPHELEIALAASLQSWASLRVADAAVSTADPASLDSWPQWGRVISAWPHHHSASTQHSLFIFGHTRSPIHIIFFSEQQIVPSSMLSLVSGINSWLPLVNHTLISPILTHPVLWVAFSLSVPSTHHSHRPSPLHSSGLKPSFFANPSHRSLPFIL